MVSITVSVFGGLLYAIAPAFATERMALASIALGRILGGLGNANSALAFAYVARACPADERTSIMSLLGGVQMIGMAIAPLFSAFLSDVDFSLLGIHFDNLNSVGLLLVVFNLISQVAVYLYLPDVTSVEEDDDKEEDNQESEWLRMLRCILRNPHLGVPVLTIFTFNFNWQFIETALAPASFDVLEWGPVEVSYVLGMMAVLVFIGMTAVHRLSKIGVSDFKLLCGGLLWNTVGYFMLYLTWCRGAHYIAFISPVFVGAGSFPFLGAPNRSMFSDAVDATSELSGYEGTMQALLSVSILPAISSSAWEVQRELIVFKLRVQQMSSSVGGFTAPSMITHYCLRTPDEVSLSGDNREFEPLALFCPFLSLAVLVATFAAGEPKAASKEVRDYAVENGDEEVPCTAAEETTPLVEKFSQRRISDGDVADDRHRRGRMQRRRTVDDIARDASIRGPMISPMTLIPPNGKIYDDA
ncbi:hypothetical protein ACHAWF_018017 [Thalassiosira exigua]